MVNTGRPSAWTTSLPRSSAELWLRQDSYHWANCQTVSCSESGRCHLLATVQESSGSTNEEWQTPGSVSDRFQRSWFSNGQKWMKPDLLMDEQFRDAAEYYIESKLIWNAATTIPLWRCFEDEMSQCTAHHANAPLRNRYTCSSFPVAPMGSAEAADGRCSAANDGVCLKTFDAGRVSATDGLLAPLWRGRVSTDGSVYTHTA